MPSSETYAIQTHNLSKSYGDVHAVKSLDLEVPQGSIFGFLGPNGAGKSTTIKLLLGLIQPTGGSASVFGLDVDHHGVEVKRRVGYLAQQPRFYTHLTARETLRFAARFFYTGPDDLIDERIIEALALVNLTGKADRLVKGFSGGEMQRLGLAQAYINHPDLLILDEPAAALDPMGREEVLTIMARLRDRGATVFYSTHILDDVQRVSDRAAILNHGQLIAQGTIDSLLAGREGPVYTMDLTGAVDAAYRRVRAQPWVKGIDSTQIVNGRDRVRWRVAVSDEQAADAQLLRVALADHAVTVLDYGREKVELEKVFMELVKGNNNGK